MSQTKKQTIQLKMQVQSAPYTTISKLLTWTKFCQKYLNKPFQLVWMLPSKGRHTQTQCLPHLSLKLLVIAHQILQHDLAAVKTKSLREFGDLCFIRKSRRPIGRDENGVIMYTQKLKNVYSHLWEICVRQVFPNFWPATHHYTHLIAICYRKSKLTY